MAMNRKQLIDTIQSSRARWERAVRAFDDAQSLQPVLPGGWTVKDVLAHIGWWERRAAQIYRSATETAPAVEPILASQVDGINAHTQREYQPVDLALVRQFEQTAYQDLLALVQTIPEADLFTENRFAQLHGGAYLDIVVWNTFEHYDEHAQVLETFLARRGAESEGHSVIRRAEEFLQHEGRDIDRALFAAFFAGGSVEMVVEVLSRYQNPDGGFYGLEVDIAAPDSNPFATEIALVIMRWCGLDGSHPLVQRTVSYLERTQEANGDWRFTPQIYQHALPPWFENWQWPNLNPAMTISGVLMQMGIVLPRVFGRVATLFLELARPEDLTGEEFYNVRPYAYFLQTNVDHPLAEFYRWGVVWWMARQNATNPQLDAYHLMEYAPVPDSEIARRLPPAMLRDVLERLLLQQQPDGGWSSPYDARWRPWVTVSSLLVLRAYHIL